MFLDYWKDIEGYEGLYSVSYCGKVRSLDRHRVGVCGRVGFKKGRILKPGASTKGYLYVVLYKNRKQKNKAVHRLVGKAFVTNPHNYQCINHKSGIKTDNRVENIEWCTYSQNNQHAYFTGLKTAKGEKNKNSKLIGKQVIEIKMLLLHGFKNSEICRKYGVRNNTISNIKTGRAWKHIIIT